MLLDSDHLHKCFLLIFGNEFPRALIISLRIRQAVIPSRLNKRCILLVFRDLTADLIFFLITEFIQIQFIAKGPRHCDHTSRLQRSDPSGLVVRRRGDMCSD